MLKVQHYFDAAQGVCATFGWGGCGGNGNRFATLEECQGTCREHMLAVPRALPAPTPPSAKEGRCSAAVRPGTCRSRIQKFYHNPKTGACQPFFYTGCGGGANMFPGVEECEAACGPPTLVHRVALGSPVVTADRCLLPREAGPCRGARPAWYYNHLAGGCEAFKYGGCRGNANNFGSLAACLAACVTGSSALTSLPEPAPPGRGLGGGGSTGGLLGGHAPSPINREVKMVASKGRQLLATTERITGPDCPDARLLEVLEAARQVVAGTNYRLKLRVEVRRGSGCGLKVEQVCSGVTVHQPLGCSEDSFATCLQLVREGDIECRGTTASSTLPQPQPPRRAGGGGLFGFGGLPGGHGDLPVDQEVKQVASRGRGLLATTARVTGPSCSHAALVDVIKASRQVVAGTNYRLVLKVKVKTGPRCEVEEERICKGVVMHRPLRCSEAEYATCLQLVREEEIVCAPAELVAVAPLVAEAGAQLAEARAVAVELETVDPCMEEKAVGRCRARMPRFYYDRASGRCAQFFYSGCRGNGNNFATEDSCEATCGRSARLLAPPTPDTCSLPMEAGPCRALRTRFHYNPAAAACQPFLYGGCRGNANNFASLEACQQRCAGTNPAPEAPRCTMGNETFALGDVVRVAGEEGGCRSCTCSSPPALTCHDVVCPLRMFVPPPGGEGCVMERDRWGCCDTGYRCTRVSPPSPPPLGGGLLGGYRREATTPETKKLAALATTSLLSPLPSLHGGCDRLTLLEVLEVHRQIVAGTNFKLKLRLRSKIAPECTLEQERECEVVVHRPLPHACTLQPCLHLPSPEDITCT